MRFPLIANKQLQSLQKKSSVQSIIIQYTRRHKTFEDNITTTITFNVLLYASTSLIPFLLLPFGTIFIITPFSYQILTQINPLQIYKHFLSLNTSRLIVNKLSGTDFRKVPQLLPPSSVTFKLLHFGTESTSTYIFTLTKV